MSSPTSKPSQGQPGRWRYYAASTTPNAFDIVWCRFPESAELKPAPKPRPGLVRRVLRNDAGQVAVEIVYGTSNLKLDRELLHQLVISQRRDLEEAGLRKPTRFDLTLTKVLPWCREFFGELRPGDGCVIGRLSAFKRLDLNEMRASLPPPAAEVRKQLAIDAALRAGIKPVTPYSAESELTAPPINVSPTDKKKPPA